MNLSEAVAGIRIDFVDIPFQGLCVTIHVPDVIRILINPSNGHSFYATFFHEVGHAMHSAHIRQTYHLFQDEVGPFCEGMADTMARFVDDRDWLIKWAKIPEQVAQEHKTAWRFVEICETRRLMSQVAFEWGMYADPGADNLAAFQATRSEYLKVPSHDTVAWADNSYWSNYPFYAQNYIVSEMIASQTHLSFRKQFGHTIQPESSKWLDEHYWSPGGSVEWTDKIAQATGAPLSPKQMILEMTNGYPPE